MQPHHFELMGCLIHYSCTKLGEDSRKEWMETVRLHNAQDHRLGQSKYPYNNLPEQAVLGVCELQYGVLCWLKDILLQEKKTCKS
jgi:hypothetical protein